MAADSDDLLLERPERVKYADIPDNKEKKRYEAFDKKGKAFPYLEIRCVLQPSQTPQFKCFINSIFSADFDNGFTLLYSFMAVEVRGRNLDAIRRAIQRGHCEFIQEFHENEFLKPAQGEPVITSVKFITGEKLGDALYAHDEIIHPKKKPH